MKNLKAECVRCGASIKASRMYCRKCANELKNDSLSPRIRTIANTLSFLLMTAFVVYFIIYSLT